MGRYKMLVWLFSTNEKIKNKLTYKIKEQGQ